MQRNFYITANGQLLMEGRTFVEGDIIATLTLEDVDVPNECGVLAVHDILSNLLYKNLKLVCTDEPEAQPAADTTGDDWYKQHDQAAQAAESPSDEDEDQDGDDQSSGEATGATGAGSLADSLPPIDLPKTVVEQLARVGVVTLADAAEKFINGDPLGISATAEKRLKEQVKAAGLLTED